MPPLAVVTPVLFKVSAICCSVLPASFSGNTVLITLCACVLAMALAAAGVAVDVAEYVLGHTSQGASRIHQQYGTPPPPRSLVAHVEKAFQMKEWGYYEHE